VYYFLFRFVIRKWNLRTPGRDEDGDNSSMEGLIDQPMDSPATATSAASPDPTPPPATT
jgi:PTS system N-acetylglucosamine-specific IIC component